MSEIKETKDIYELLQKVRLELSKTELKKSGHNAFAKFDYFELKDFVPKATELFDKYGLTPLFSIKVDTTGVEYAILTIVHKSEQITFSCPTAESTASSSPIQNRGSVITYMRRYLYLIALDLTENDTEDAMDPKDKKSVAKKPTPKATKEQIKMIRELYDPENIGKICEYYKVEKLEDLNIVDASMAIEKKRKANA